MHEEGLRNADMKCEASNFGVFRQLVPSSMLMFLQHIDMVLMGHKAFSQLRFQFLRGHLRGRKGGVMRPSGCAADSMLVAEHFFNQGGNNHAPSATPTSPRALAARGGPAAAGKAVQRPLPEPAVAFDGARPWARTTWVGRRFYQCCTLGWLKGQFSVALRQCQTQLSTSQCRVQQARLFHEFASRTKQLSWALFSRRHSRPTWKFVQRA